MYDKNKIWKIKKCSVITTRIPRRLCACAEFKECWTHREYPTADLICPKFQAE